MDSVVPAVVQSFMYNEMSGGGGGFINKSKSKSSVIQRKSVSYKEENIEVIDDRTFDRFLEKVMPSPNKGFVEGRLERQSVTKRRLPTKSKSMKYVKKAKINL